VIARQKRDEWVATIRQESGGSVQNPNSSAQLKGWMGVDSTAKKKLDKVLADENCDEALPAKVQMVKSLRQWEIATGRYYSAIRDALDGDVLHPQLRLTGAVVRLSCGRPNMQAVPRTKDEKPHPAYHGIKASIIAREGNLLCEMDYSQAEIVVSAHYCNLHAKQLARQDPARLSKWAKMALAKGDSALYVLIKAGVGLHDKVVAETGLSRDAAKALNFMVPYGVGKAGFAEFRMCSLEQAERELTAHYGMFPEWRSLYETMQHQAKTAKKVTLWSGRTRHFTGSEKEHSAMNNLVQGAVSELMRVTICRLARELPELQMGLTVHDSIIADAPADRADEIWRETSRIASDFPWLDPGIRMDYKRGPSWASATAPKS
jgi:DNA polymerase-1